MTQDHLPPAQSDTTRCGFVAILGAPNAGKSTLTNNLVGSKITIVSPKVQTTRSKILGIAMLNDTQAILVDTPGIFAAPKERLERSMVHAAWSAAHDADMILVLLDASSSKQDETVDLLQKLSKQEKKAHLVLNKIDIISKEHLLTLADRFKMYPCVDQIFMISALNGDGLEGLKTMLETTLPSGVWLYPEDQLSNMPERLLAAEITREQLFLKLRQEVPYACAVETESWETFKNGDVKISQIIYVQRDSQKPIILGKGGATIQMLGQAARYVMTETLGRTVHLKLHVKVQEKWAENPSYYKMFGLEYKV